MIKTPSTRGRTVKINGEYINAIEASNHARIHEQEILDSVKDDPVLGPIFNKARERALLQDGLGDNFILSPITIGPEKGKVQIEKRPRPHDMEVTPETIVALGRARLFQEQGGESLVGAKGAADDAIFAEAVANRLGTRALEIIGEAGLRPEFKEEMRAAKERGGVTDPDFLAAKKTLNERGKVLAQDHNRGFNKLTGAPFGRPALDGGHIVAHSVDPSLSSDPSNIMLENQYENKSKLNSDDPEVIINRINNYYNEDENNIAKAKSREARMKELVESRVNPEKLPSFRDRRKVNMLLGDGPGLRHVLNNATGKRMAKSALSEKIFMEEIRPILSARLNELVASPQNKVNKALIQEMLPFINRYAPKY